MDRYAGRVLGSILEAIGQTPLVSLDRVRPAGAARILAKVELLNPSGSVKARPAYAMVRAAEEQGLLRPDSILVEASSGNQGIALAMIGAVLGYRVVIVMPSGMSSERAAIIRAYGAETIITDAGRNISEAIANATGRARQMAADDPRVFYVQQFSNLANPQAHEDTTAAEILAALGPYTPDTRIDAFLAGIGTGGTLTGVGRVLKGRFPGMQVIAVEPDRAAILSGGQVHDHIQQGIGDGVIPDVLDVPLIDRTVIVSDDQAVATARLLARKEGLFTGISAGSNVCAAMRVASELGPGGTVVTICPDTGERYLSMGIAGGEVVPG